MHTNVARGIMPDNILSVFSVFLATTLILSILALCTVILEKMSALMATIMTSASTNRTTAATGFYFIIVVSNYKGAYYLPSIDFRLFKIPDAATTINTNDKNSLQSLLMYQNLLHEMKI